LEVLLNVNLNKKEKKIYPLSIAFLSMRGQLNGFFLLLCVFSTFYFFFDIIFGSFIKRKKKKTLFADFGRSTSKTKTVPSALDLGPLSMPPAKFFSIRTSQRGQPKGKTFIPVTLLF
jgi:hypothetical protein